jgi:hypothetical protein
MSKRLTMEQNIDRFVARITTRRVEQAYRDRVGQCIGCMTTIKGEMFDDTFQNYVHLGMHMQEGYLTWGTLKHAYRDKGLSEQRLCIDIYKDLDTVQEYVKDFLMKRLVQEVKHETN